MSSSARRWLSDVQAGSLARAISGFPVRSRERGVRYARSGRVLGIRQSGDTIDADVAGTRRYTTSREWDERKGWAELCSCPVTFECKHALAVAWCVLRHAAPSG